MGWKQRTLRTRAKAGHRQIVVANTYLGAKPEEEWTFEQLAASERDEHPVTTFRRLATETTARIDAALVAIHGDPNKETATP